jgi:phage tail tape-measure protein
MIIDQLVAQLGWDLTGEQDLKKFKQGMTDAERGLSQFAARMGTFAIAAATAFAGGMAALGKSVVSTSAEFEKLEATLTTIEGSTDKARKALDWVAEFAKQTPYDLQEVSEAFVRLRAYGLDPTNGLLEDLGNASSAMGKGLMQAVEMIADASTGEFERLKEFGIRASQEGDKVTFSWTENGKTLTKTVKKAGDEITRFLQDRFSSRFAGAMERQSKTWNGMIANLGDTWTDFQRRIGEAGFFDAVKSQLGRAMDYIEKLDADGTIDRVAKAISDGLVWALDQANYAISRLKRHFDAISGWITDNSETWEKIRLGLLAIAAVVFPKTAALLVLEDVLSYLEGGDSIIGDLANSLEELTGIDADKIGALMSALAGGGSALLVLGFLTPAVRRLAAAVGLFSTGAAAAGTSNLLRLLGIGGAGIAGEAAVLGAGKDAIMNDPEKRSRTEKGNAWIQDMRDSVRDTLYGDGRQGSFDAGRFGSGVPQFIESDAYRNFIEHTRKINADHGAAVQRSVQDNRNQSVKVEVGGVVVQGVQNVNAAVGGAIGQAVGNAAVGRATRYEKDDAF